MNGPAPKTVGSKWSSLQVGTIGGLVVGFTLFYGTLQLAHRVVTGQWLRGGVNPGEVLVYWVRDGGEFGLPQLLTLAALLVPAMAASLALLWLLGRRRTRRAEIDRTARYLGDGAAFTEAAVREHAQSAQLTTGETIGLPVARMVRGGQWLWAGFRDSMTLIMGPGSGKTQGVVVPLAIQSPGPVWVTSNRSDVVGALYTSRSDKGRLWCFDPQHVADMEPTFYYDPLSYIRAKPGEADVRAQKLAKQFADAGRPPDSRTDPFFDTAGTDLAANLLLAAALDHLPISRVLNWTAQRKSPRPEEILRRHDQYTSAEQVKGIQELAPETRDSVYQTAATQLSFLKNASARPWVERIGSTDDRPEFHPEDFVRSAGDTVISLSREGVGSFGPLIAAMTNATIEAAEEHARSQANGRLPVPLALLLDEVANVCRITSLPDLISHAGGRGIFLVPILQSYAQGKSAWGEVGMDKLWGASVVRLLGRGVIDPALLKQISDVAGDQDVQRITHSKSSGRGGGSRSTSTQWTREPVLSVADLAALPQWRAVAVGAGERPVLVRLVPWFDEKDASRTTMRAGVDASRAAFAASRPPTKEVA